MSERFARDVLIKHKWSIKDLTSISIIIKSRSPTRTTSTLMGSDIDHLGRSFFHCIDGTTIPYHRILEIQKNGVVIWNRPDPTGH